MYNFSYSEITLEQALDIANSAMLDALGRYLSDVETIILKGAWKKQTYQTIADTSGYTSSYLTRDVGPRFWKYLSQAVGETVSKTNFQAALKRYHHQKVQSKERFDDVRQNSQNSNGERIVPFPGKRQITPHYRLTSLHQTSIRPASIPETGLPIGCGRSRFD
jgi:hypothetical protein